MQKVFSSKFRLTLLAAVLSGTFGVSMLTGCGGHSKTYTSSLVNPPSLDYAAEQNYAYYQVSSLDSSSSENIDLQPEAGYRDLPSYCRLKDRFDRKALIAYQWGKHDRKRLALDVDGLGSGIDGVRLEYSLRLQKPKHRKMKCRYASQWQGLIGSGYNELYRRDPDQSMWKDIRRIRNDAMDRLDTLRQL